MSFYYLRCCGVQILIRDSSEQARTLEERCRIGILFSQAHELVGFQVNDKAVAAFAAKEAKAAIGFLTKGDDQVEKSLREMLQTATKTALQLDSIFISSKAQLQPRWPRQGPHFDDKVRDEFIEVAFDNALSKTGRNKPRFKFSISPFVEKRGNAEGYSYADRMVLCKAKAVLG